MDVGECRNKLSFSLSGRQYWVVPGLGTGNIGSHADQGGNLGLHPDQTDKMGLHPDQAADMEIRKQMEICDTYI